MPFVEVTCWAIECDRCQERLEDEFSCWTDLDGARDTATESWWKVDGNVVLCDDCHNPDDEMKYDVLAYPCRQEYDEAWEGYFHWRGPKCDAKKVPRPVPLGWEHWEPKVLEAERMMERLEEARETRRRENSSLAWNKSSDATQS